MNTEKHVKRTGTAAKWRATWTAEKDQEEWHAKILETFNTAVTWPGPFSFVIGKMQIDRDGSGSSIKVGKLTFAQLKAIDAIVNG